MGEATQQPGVTNHPLPEKEDSFSLAGCGFLGVYHIGAVSCLRRHVPHLLENAKFAGASAGALLACCLVCDVPLSECMDFTLRLVNNVRRHPLRAFDPNVVIDKILRNSLEQVLPQNAHKLCSGRLFVSVTKLRGLAPPDFGNEIISHFETREDLIQAILHSSFVPIFSDTREPILKEEITMDGGFTDNLPTVDENTILVSPFAGECDICPEDEIPHYGIGVRKICNTSVNLSINNFIRLVNGFFAPPASILKDYCWKGYDDALRYLTKNNMIRCQTHSIFTHLLHRQHPLHEDCEECVRHIQQAHQTKDQPENSSFIKIIQQIEGAVGLDPGPFNTMWEVASCVAWAPFEIWRLLNIALGLGKRTVKSAVDVSVEQVQDVGNVLEMFLNSLTDPGKLLKSILFRSSILFTLKAAELCLRVLGYACCTRVGQYLIAAYLQEVQKNLDVQAQEHLETQAAAEALGLQQVTASAPAAPACRPSGPKAAKQLRNRNAATMARPAQAKVVKQQRDPHLPDLPQPTKPRMRADHQNVLALLEAEEEAHQDSCRDILQFLASVDFDTQTRKNSRAEAEAEGVNYQAEIAQVRVDSAPLAGLEDEEGAVGGDTPMRTELCQALLGMLRDTEEVLTIHYKDSAGDMQTESLFAVTPSRNVWYPSADQEDGLRNDAPPTQQRLKAEVMQLIKTKILESESAQNFERKHEEAHQRHLREQNLPDVGEEQHHFSLQVVGFKAESPQSPSESGSGDTNRPTSNSAADLHNVRSASDASIVAAKTQEQKNQKFLDRKHT